MPWPLASATVPPCLGTVFPKTAAPQGWQCVLTPPAHGGLANEDRRQVYPGSPRCVAVLPTTAWHSKPDAAPVRRLGRVVPIQSLPYRVRRIDRCRVRRAEASRASDRPLSRAAGDLSKTLPSPLAIR